MEDSGGTPSNHGSNTNNPSRGSIGADDRSSPDASGEKPEGAEESPLSPPPSSDVAESATELGKIACGRNEDGSYVEIDIEIDIKAETNRVPSSSDGKTGDNDSEEAIHDAIGDAMGDAIGDSAEEEEVSASDNDNDVATVFAFYRKLTIGLIFLAVVLFAIIDSVFGKKHIRAAITSFLEWNQDHPYEGMAAFVAIYFVATLICVPGALLTVGAGFVFSASFDGSLVAGVCLGTLAVFAGAFTSSIVAFLLARYLLYDRVRRFSKRQSVFVALDAALAQKGFRIMCLLRLCPIMPFVLLNYIAGVTTVRLSSYVLANFCQLPGTVLYVFLGASAGSLAAEDGPSGGGGKTKNKTVTITVVTLGVVFGLLAIGVTSYYARQELNKEVDSYFARSRQYQRTTSLRRQQQRMGYKRNLQRRQRSRYRRSIDRMQGRP